jgi:uroporphyrinogen-III synthase/hydroxymethylbilane synthase
LGLSPKQLASKNEVVFYPIIKINHYNLLDKAFNKMWEDFSAFTHLLFTSKTTVDQLLPFIKKEQLKDKIIIAIGRETEKKLLSYEIKSIVCKEETSEGVVEVLKTLVNPYILYAHSKNARPVIGTFLKENNINHLNISIYEPQINLDLPQVDLNHFDEVFFTSPSTVDAFFSQFSDIPVLLKLSCIGPITQNYLNNFTSNK